MNKPYIHDITTLYMQRKSEFALLFEVSKDKKNPKDQSLGV